MMMQGRRRAAGMLAAAVTFGLAATADAHAATLRPPPDDLVATAAAVPCVDFKRAYTGAYTTSAWDSGATLILAAEANAGGTAGDARLLQQLRHTLGITRCAKWYPAGSGEPVAAGGYSAQHELWVTAMLAVVRHTPRVWEALSADERARADLIMTGTLVAGAFTTSDANPYVLAGAPQRAIDGGGNLDRDWNPNYREGMVGTVLTGIAYFGPQGAAEVLRGFDRQAFLDDARAAGLQNLVTTYDWDATHPGSGAAADADLAQALGDWAYHGVGLDDPVRLFAGLTSYTYGADLACGLRDGLGVPTSTGLLAGRSLGPCDAPAGDVPGMLREFDGWDAAGRRSSAAYAYDGFKANLANQVALVAAGLWERGPVADEAVALQSAGIDDLFAKLRAGYINYAKGGVQPPPGAPAGVLVQQFDAPYRYGRGYAFTEALWRDVVRPAVTG